MKAITREWLNRAWDDLVAAELLLTNPQLSNLVAFHAQQAVEKSLKAILEESDLHPVKTHSLTRLYGSAEPYLSIHVDPDMLDRLEAVYIEARYPGEMGLLPGGKPTQEEANDFFVFAQNFYRDIKAICETSSQAADTESNK